jgi:hypothetical protein
MYKFTPEEKKVAKMLIRQLYDQYYLNPIRAGIQEGREAEQAKQKVVPTEAKMVGPVPVASFTDVKGFVLGQPWAERTTIDLAITYSQSHPEVPLAKVRQYVQRITWKLKKKNVAA